ncbi:MAG TPA: YegS/Rv2252/BmrU family lipid kinase [Mycobacteriales bacterium]|nr:YegS/Rv2252/BmrU family lipid kinase [Mycobacteriales bacterium]
MKQCVLVVNPTSGKGKGATAVGPVAQRLGEHNIGVRVVTGRDAADATDIARKAVADGVDAVVAVGGDGMVHLVAQAIAGTDTPLGIIPAGSGNDWARHLGLPFDAVAAADVIAAGRTRPVDAVRWEGGWWVNVLGAGFDSRVQERGNALHWPKGPRRYDLATLLELKGLKPIPFRITLDGEELQTDACFVTVGNGAAYGGGMQIVPTAVADDGLLDVVVIGAVSRFTLARMFPTVYKGTHVRHPAVQQHRARVVRLEAPGEVSYADGERLGPLPITSECVRGAIQLLS